MVRALDWGESDFRIRVANPELPDKVLTKQLATTLEQLLLFAPVLCQDMVSTPGPQLNSHFI
jgi:hypothetical protein